MMKMSDAITFFERWADMADETSGHDMADMARRAAGDLRRALDLYEAIWDAQWVGGDDA
jgi:hypothetical protein